VTDLLDSLVNRGIISSDSAANVQPYLDAASNFATGGLQRALGLPGNFVTRALQNPDNVAAMGMANPFPVSRLGRPGIQGQLGKFQLDDLHKDFQAGLNNQEIANKYNVTKEAIQQRRTQLGYPQKARGRPPQTDQE
jgi:hypothetical protein